MAGLTAREAAQACEALAAGLAIAPIKGPAIIYKKVDIEEMCGPLTNTVDVWENRSDRYMQDRDNNGVFDIYEEPKINPKTGGKYSESQNWRPRIDPLTLDLDGDGIETLGVNASNHILFDHDGDGAKHGTGWVSADDAMLVLDRNGNGTIDNGRELFGDNTQLANGRFAADGFEALADIDSNGDVNRAANDTFYESAA